MPEDETPSRYRLSDAAIVILLLVVLGLFVYSLLATTG
jgi:hypothetical protein